MGNTKDRKAISETLTPFDVKNKEFKKVVWGYSPHEVVDFLDATARTWEKVQRHEKDMIEEIRLLNQEIGTWKEREPELQILKDKAQVEADAIRAQAEEDGKALLTEVKRRAEDIRVRTEEWLASVIKEVEGVEARKEGFLSTLRGALDQHYALLNEEGEPKEPLGAHLSRYLSRTETRVS